MSVILVRKATVPGLEVPPYSSATYWLPPWTLGYHGIYEVQDDASGVRVDVGDELRGANSGSMSSGYYVSRDAGAVSVRVGIDSGLWVGGVESLSSSRRDWNLSPSGTMPLRLRCR